MDENKVTYFAQTDSRNKKTPFGIKRKDRSKHMYVIGKTGMGKSTLLENMAVQDIQSGEGMAFIDPHGKTAELLLDYVPEHRVKDVLYFAPFDMEYPVSFNVMEDVGADKRHLVANGLMSTFEKIWVDAWSARMAYILNNTILALLEYPGSTLLSVNRMLADKDYRKKVVDNVSDPSVKSFWVDEFGKYTERFAQEATPAIQNKVGQFTSNPLIRNIIGQPTSTFDIRKMMDERKIIIINLSKGRVGEGNANLLGSMLITKMYLAAMSRADTHESELRKLPNFYLYVDEFQSFANKSFADILSEARKYKLNLTIAHQYIEQMEEEVRAAVFGNVGTMITFRVGAYDAEVLEKEFAPQFEAVDLVNLGAFQVYLKLMIDGISSQPFSATTLGPIVPPVRSSREEIIASSRAQFGKPRAEVEENIKKWHEDGRAAVNVGKGSASSGAGAAGVGGAFGAGGAGIGGMAGAQKGGRSMRGPNDPSTPREMMQQKAQVQPKTQTQAQFSQSTQVEPRPPIQSQVQPVARPISLNELKPVSGGQAQVIVSDKAKKERSPENISALKSALASVLKDSANSFGGQKPASTISQISSSARSVLVAAVPVPAPASSPVSLSVSSSTTSSQFAIPSTQNLKEVPKKVLEELLEVPREVSRENRTPKLSNNTKP